jgi:putative transposase
LSWTGSKKKLTDQPHSQLKSLVDPHDSLPIQRQCELLGLPRSSFYYQPASETLENLLYMRLMDQQYLDTPFFGVGQFTDWLRLKGHEVNPKRVRRLLRLMGLRAVCPGPHTSKPGKGEDHKVYPYLLNDVIISQVGQVYGTDITYIPLDGGFLYLTAFIDWFSRYILSWELSNSLDTSFCLVALDQACAVRRPALINTDQGAQYTSLAFSERVVGQGIALSMDGKRRAIDNVFTERFWRSLKYEEVYLKSYEDGHQAYEQISRYIQWYNQQRPHSSLGGKTPQSVFES